MSQRRFDPYRALGALGVDFYVDTIEPDLMGYYEHDRRRVTISRDLTQAERRCTIAHEYAHAARGDLPACTDWHERKQEATARQTAARLLIQLPDLADALRWTDDVAELAEELWVDADTVRARLHGLDDAERRFILAVRAGEEPYARPPAAGCTPRRRSSRHATVECSAA